MTLFIVPFESRAEGRPPLMRDCSEKHVTALGQVACELARALPASSTHIVLRGARVTSSLPLSRSTQISERLSVLLAAELGPRAHASKLDDARGTEASPLERPELLELGVTLGQSHITVSAEIVRKPRRFWERFTVGAPSTTFHTTARRPIDAELRSFLPPIPLVVKRVERVTPPEDASLAIVCADDDADGDFEIVSVGRRKIQLGKILAGQFRTLKSLEWSDVSEVSPRPLREPIASAWAPAPGSFDVGLTDRTEALRLDATLTIQARFPGQLPWPGGGCTRTQSPGLEASRAPCSTGLPPIAPGNEHVDALAGARLPRQDGSSFTVFLRRRVDARAVLEVDGRAQELGETVGAQLVVADLNADGRAEIVTSANTLDPSADELRIRTLSSDGKLEDMFRLPIPSGVRSLGVCPNRGRGLAPILAVSAEALWILE